MADANRIAELKQRCDAIEECYEFMLAYAAQGLPSDAGSSTGSRLRDLLKRCDEAMGGLGRLFRDIAESGDVSPREPYLAFVDVLERDAAAAQTALRLVASRSAISSQLVDNLNASIHLRALLTDVFLIDEVVRPGAADASST